MNLIKSTLSILLFFNLLTSNAQWDIKVPDINNTKNKLLADKALIKEIETQMGLPFNQLQFESDGWVGYQNSPFSLSYSDCGDKMYPAWPKDECYAKFIVTGPKDKDGVYKIMGVYADYSRSSFNGEECKLYNQWTYKGYRIENVQEYGYKEFTIDEAKTLLMDYLNSGEAHTLDNFIEITSIDFDNFGQSSSNAGMHHLNYFFKGNEAIFTDDGTSIIGIRDPGTLIMTLQVEKKDNKWIGSKLGLLNGTYRLYDQSYDPRLTTNQETKMYATYKDGLNEIYPKRTEKTKVDGELEALTKRINELYRIMEAKKLDLVFTDIQDFFAPDDASFAEEWFITNFTESPTRYIVLSHNLEKVLPYKYTQNDQTQKIAFPELQVKTEKYNRPKKKYILETRCSNCQKRSSSNGAGSTYHPCVWIFKDGKWYLIDAQSAFLMREVKIDFRE